MSKLPWKAASTLIIAARNASIKNEAGGFDYQLLLLKRSAKSGFMAKAYVFPGGIVDEFDSNPQYENIFNQLNLNSFDYKAKHVPDLYLNRGPNSLTPEVALRIAAIRETFEETGVLLCRPTTLLPKPETLKEWRKKVFLNAADFLKMCSEYHLVPDLESVHEWSCWLTPVDVGPRRFDTMFYISCVEDIPMASVDDSEISEFKWLTPEEALRLHASREIWLAPPQVYEMSRFLSFRSFDQLKTFAEERAAKGVCRWMPVRMNATDGAVSVLPGDYLYPQNPDFYGTEETRELEKPLEELRKHEHQNRYEYQDFFKAKLLLQNVEDPCGHVKPTSFEPLINSKL